MEQTPATEPVLSSSIRCRYSNRFCNNPRTIKKDGALHSLCEEHRVKANENQQRLRDNKKRKWEALMRQAKECGNSTMAAILAEGAEDLEFDPLDSMANGSLSPSEWEAIAEILNGDEDSLSGP